MRTERKCPDCEGKLVQISHRLRRVFGGRTLEADVPAMKCKDCKAEPQVAIGVLLAFDRAIVKELASSGPVGGESFRFLRDAANLSGQELAVLLDVRRETVSRWEHDRAPIDRAAWVTIGALAIDQLGGRDDTVRRLQALGKKGRKRVHLDLAA
jgi:DNA-binding transcriptional regulator YiaG